jgi:2,5-furandicarboxylate decarboxylase 1
LLGGIPREATLLAHLRRSFPNVRDVHLARGGVCRYHLYVQIAKRQEGEAKNVMMGAFAGHYDVKHVIVVDEDVDIHNPIIDVNKVIGSVPSQSWRKALGQ